MNTARSHISWETTLRRGTLATTGVVILLFCGWQAVPFDIRFEQPADRQQVDPRKPLVVTTVGIASEIVEVVIQDENGRRVVSQATGNRFESSGSLQFGMHYSVTVKASRDWARQSLTRTIDFDTVAVPKLAGKLVRTFAPDGSVVLSFNRPVGSLQVETALDLAVEPAADRLSYRLQARSRGAQGSQHPVRVNWKTDTGVELPPLALTLKTPPPLTARLNVRGLERVGLALPVIVTFSEPLRNRDNSAIRVETDAGEAIAGRWSKLGRRLQFRPTGGWPALDTIRVTVGTDGLLAAGGGYLEKPLVETFTTGADRRIAVYLDTQTAVASEDGQVVRSFPVSSGKAGTPTITGTFYIERRYAMKTMTSSASPGRPGYYKVENVPYAQFFQGGYAFHGAWWHNNFGRPMSHGCVNLSTRSHNRRWPNATDDAKWLWDWAALGVPVTVYARTPATGKNL